MKTAFFRVAMLATLLGAMPALAQPVNSNDLVMDQPSLLGTAWSAASRPIYWAGGVLGSTFSFLLPPSAGDLASSAKDEDGSELFRLLGLAGYKLKEIDNDVGLIPGVSFKFAIVREMSEADMDYLDEHLELSQIRNPGLYSQLQRAIIRTVVGINSAGGMQVSELKLTVLPLPKASFSVTPSQVALDEENSALMRAIQRVDRRVRGIATMEVKPAATATR
jgi:hypothetical protein